MLGLSAEVCVGLSSKFVTMCGHAGNLRARLCWTVQQVCDHVWACRQPQSKIAADMNPTGKAAKSTLMRKLLKKKPAGAGRAAKVSLEGRGIML